MRVTADIEKLHTGKYAVMVNTPNGPTCADGVTIEGVARAVVLSIVDALEECVDLKELDRWIES